MKNELNNFINGHYTVEDNMLVRKVIGDYDSIYEASYVIRHYTTLAGFDFEMKEIELALEEMHSANSDRFTLQNVIRTRYEVINRKLHSKMTNQCISLEYALEDLCLVSDQIKIIDYSPDSNKAYYLLVDYIDRSATDIADDIEKIV
jgi:hypothetical protein